ncbi:hypothetical protein [Chitinophaga sp. sic0106]|uniref:hypothetical protein n=1 Tax=Chitinophaga sp. sic0106 TaxID=2854785 RepID=UPI001C46D8E7|nr:hypothetical protein [Chitinophaga sp. sic0106]MBV7534038.1 hypothetical protein [Chitinophaga sp. sic0106]
MFIARKSNNIQEDIKRNWSSWNFGEGGFEGTRTELDAYLATATDNHSVSVSGFEIYPDLIREFEFAELYAGYWVAVDNVNAKNGLSCIYLDAETREDAIAEATARTDYWGDGDSFDATEATLVFSEGDIHVFEI